LASSFISRGNVSSSISSRPKHSAMESAYAVYLLDYM
jgi:hypothetical protein